jgi:hypothetical protein
MNTTPTWHRAVELQNAEDQTRLAFLEEKHILFHPRMSALVDDLKAIVEGPSPQDHYQAVFARSFNGKSTTASLLVDCYPIDFNPLGDAAIAPVVRISLPGVASVREFALRILRAVGEPVNPRWSGDHLLSCAYQVLISLQTKMLIIDEFQHLGSGTPLNRKALTNTIKSIGEDCGLAVVVFGVPYGIELITKDPQLTRRFEQRGIEPWTYGVESCELLDNMEALLPLRKRSNIGHNPELVDAILELGDGVIGHIRDVVVDAARTAIATGREVIDIQTLEQLRWVPPSVRKAATVSLIKASPDDLLAPTY